MIKSASETSVRPPRHQDVTWLRTCQEIGVAFDAITSLYWDLQVPATQSREVTIWPKAFEAIDSLGTTAVDAFLDGAMWHKKWWLKRLKTKLDKDFKGWVVEGLDVPGRTRLHRFAANG